MTYSSALFTSLDETLEDGQRAKYRHLATLLDLKAGQEVLEVGCGWGAFALMAAREYGCRVTGITLSREQAAFARQRVAEEGLADRIDIRYQDYRDVTGRYDRIASIEMFEAVGERYWPRFFHLLDGWLKPGGVAAMQVITIEEARFPAYRRNTDFIQHYIFPGGMLPTPTALRREIGKAGLRPTAMVSFGSSYGRTLKLWHQAFQGNWPRIRELGFSERFKRMWEYYLAYCEAGFRAGSIDVGQWRIERSAAAQPPA
jgi:cyclopropane-fatty-acyl-phospholipid synthase